MGKAPEMKDPKSQAGAVQPSPLQARVSATQPLPRQTFQQRPSLGQAMTAQPGPQPGMGGSGRYDPQAVMELLKRGG